MKDAVAFGFNLPEIPGLGTTAGLEVNLQDRQGKDVRELRRVRCRRALADMNKLPELPGAATTFRANVPQVFVQVDRETAKARGVKLDDLFATLQAMLSTLYINDFNLYGRTYRVQAEAQARFRQRPEDIGRLYVRGRRRLRDDPALRADPGRVPRSGPAGLSRFNGFTFRAGDRPRQPGVSSRPACSTRSSGCSTRLRAPRAWATPTAASRIQERASSGQAGLVFVLGLVHGVPGAGGAVRELVDPVRGALGHSVRRARRVPRRLAPRDAERHLLPDRAWSRWSASRPRTRS